MGNVRIFWFTLILMGAGTTIVGASLQGRADREAVAADSLRDDASALLGFAQSTGLDMTGAGVTALGGLIAFMGLIGFARTFREDKTDEEPGIPPELVTMPAVGGGTAPLGVPAKLDEPTDAELLRRLAWPTVRADTKPPATDGSTGARHPLAVPPEPRPQPPPPRPSVPEDPTTWQHPDGFLFLFDDRDPKPFFDLVRDLGGRHLPGSRLLVARLEAVTNSRRALVAVLGGPGSVERFDSIYRQFAGLEFGARDLNPSRTKPHAILQARSYDPAWVVPNPEPYRREREAMRRGAYLVRESTTL